MFLQRHLPPASLPTSRRVASSPAQASKRWMKDWSPRRSNLTRRWDALFNWLVLLGKITGNLHMSWENLWLP